MLVFKVLRINVSMRSDVARNVVTSDGLVFGAVPHWCSGLLAARNKRPPIGRGVIHSVSHVPTPPTVGRLVEQLVPL